MARFGKTVKIVENLIDKAFDKGQGHITRGGQKVYQAELGRDKDKGFEYLIFKHYGTTTLIYNLSNSSIVQYYGESSSDRDSLNTVLDVLGHNYNEYFRYGSNMGFVLEGQKEKVLT